MNERGVGGNNDIQGESLMDLEFSRNECDQIPDRNN